MVPSTERSGRAPRGSSPWSATSTVTVPARTAGSMRETTPAMKPLRVSIDAFWPTVTSRACVSAMRSSALSLSGCATTASTVPAGRFWPISTGTSCSTPEMPGRSCSVVELAAAQVVESAGLLEAGLLRGELLGVRLRRDRRAA